MLRLKESNFWTEISKSNPKKCDLSNIQDNEKQLKCLQREILLQRKMSHPNITKLHGYFIDKGKLYILLELAEKGNLYYYIKEKKKLSEIEVPFL